MNFLVNRPGDVIPLREATKTWFAIYTGWLLNDSLGGLIGGFPLVR